MRISPRVAAASAMKLPISMWSGPIRKSAPPSCSAPCTISWFEPMPSMRAPICSSSRHRSCTCGSDAALWMTVDPGVSAAAISAFSVPMTDGSSMKKSQARSPSPASIRYTRLEATVAPRARKASRCGSRRRRPITSPPGGGMTARPKRASSGPATRNDARMRSVFSIGISTSASTSEAHSATTFSSRHSISTPRCSSSSSIASTSRMRGMLRSTTSSSVKSDAASTGRAAFLLPAGTTVPDSGYPPSMRNFSIAAGSVPKGCFPPCMRRVALTLVLFAACCALPGAVAASPWSFIVAPTEQIGVPGYPAGTEITPEGYLYTGSAEIVWRVGPHLRPWNVPIRTLADGRYPVVSSSTSAGGVTYALTTFAAAAGGQPVDFVRVRIINRGRSTASVGWAIGTRYTGGEPKGNGRRFRFARPVAPARSGLYYQPGYGFNAHSVHRFAGQALLRDNRALYITHGTPRGLHARRVRGTRHAKPTSLVGVTRYRGRLGPGRSVVLDFTVPTVPVEHSAKAYRAIAAASYERSRAHVLATWRRMLGGAMDLHVPEG